MKSLEQILEFRNIQPTAMRLLVLNTLQQSHYALSLAEHENHCEQAHKKTHYQTLNTFEKNKLVHIIEDGSVSIKYALCHLNCQCLPEQPHVHFHCNKCEQPFR